MSVRIKLKNRDDQYVIIDKKVQDEILANKYLQSIRLLENLRAHSNGYAVFQRCITTKQGPTYETIYLHKYIAEKFVKKPKEAGGKKLLVRFINGDVLDARIENLEWTTMAALRRQSPNSRNRSGYRGVIQEKDRFRAIIYHDRKAINLGVFKTAEQAAEAYNRKSRELYGETPSLNLIKKNKK